MLFEFLRGDGAGCFKPGCNRGREVVPEDSHLAASDGSDVAAAAFISSLVSRGLVRSVLVLGVSVPGNFPGHYGNSHR